MNCSNLTAIGEVRRNGKLDGLVSVIIVVVVVVVVVAKMPHGVSLIAGFVKLQREEARLIKSTKQYYVILHYYRVRR